MQILTESVIIYYRIIKIFKILLLDKTGRNTGDNEMGDFKLQDTKNVMAEAGKSFGTYLNIKRGVRKATLEALCEGLCTVSMLTAIEHGEKNPGRQLRERLLGRVGVSSDEYETYLGYDEYVEWSMQQEILKLLEQGDTGKALGTLEEYAEKYSIAREREKTEIEETPVCEKASAEACERKDDVIGRLRRQFYLGMKGMCLKQQGASAESLSGLFGEAVKLTVPGIDERPINELALSAQELDLVLEYERYRQREGVPNKYREILKYLSSTNLEDNSRVLNYPKTVLYLCRALLAQEEADINTYTQILKLCGSGIELLRTTKRMYYLWELLELKKQMIEKIRERHRQKGESQKEEALSEMLADTEEWKNEIAGMYERFCVSKEQKECFYIYYDQDVRYIGDVIRIRRKMLGMEREELCEGICSLDTLQRLENRKKNTQPPILWELCARLGLSAECERTELVTADARARDLEREIRYSANAEQFEQNLSQLEELKMLIDMSNNINCQWVLCIEGMAKYRLGQISLKQYEDCLKQALECTLPTSILELSDTQECYLTNSEMTCIYHYSMLGREENPQEAYERMRLVNRIQEEFEERGEAQNHIRGYELYGEYKSSLLHNMGEYELSKECAKKVITLCLRMGRMNMLDGALYNWMRSMRMQMLQTEPREDGGEWKKDLRSCLVLSRLCKNTVEENFYSCVLEKCI